MIRGLRTTSFARCAWRRRFGSSCSSQTSTRCAAVMNVATKRQPGAGHGNGSVLTQNQPTCSWPSSVQSSSASSGTACSKVPAAPGWISSRLTRAKVATGSRPSLPAQEKRPGCARYRSADRYPGHVVAHNTTVERVKDANRWREGSPAGSGDGTRKPAPVETDEGEPEGDDGRAGAVEQRIQRRVANRDRQARRRRWRPVAQDARGVAARIAEAVGSVLRSLPQSRHDADDDPEDDGHECDAHQQRPEHLALQRVLLHRLAE